MFVAVESSIRNSRQFRRRDPEGLSRACTGVAVAADAGDQVMQQILKDGAMRDAATRSDEVLNCPTTSAPARPRMKLRSILAM